MLSRLAVPHLTEVNRAFGTARPEAKSNQMFQVKPRDSACQSRDRPDLSSVQRLLRFHGR